MKAKAPPITCASGFHAGTTFTSSFLSIVLLLLCEAGGVHFSHAYAYNNLNLRTQDALADGSAWHYGYDKFGQLTSAQRRWSDGSPVAGQQFGYSFDDIGNRTSTASGGNQWGSNLRHADYTANDLNQYAQRIVPPALDVLGSATNAATVTVNLQPTERKDAYFRAEVPFDNSASALWLSLTNVAVLNQGGTNEDVIAEEVATCLCRNRHRASNTTPTAT